MIIGRFIITEIIVPKECDCQIYDPMNAELALGDIVIEDGKNILFAHNARSGGYGKGRLPTGEYEIPWMDYRTGDPYSQFGYGWGAFLQPMFKTDRTDLLIHPDGNVQGSNGCVVIPFINLEENVRCSHVIRDALEIQKVIPFSVLQILKGKKC